MKKIVYWLLLTVVTFIAKGSYEAAKRSWKLERKPHNVVSKKKKILIFTSNGGGGQTAVNKALSNELKEKYNVVSTLYFPQIANKVDPVSWCTLGYYTGEDLYNHWQKNGFFSFLQGSYEVSRWYYYAVSPFLTSQTVEYIEKENPDLVISIIPIVNNAIAKACARTQTPLLIVPPDFNVAFYTQDLRLKSDAKSYVHIALPFDNELSRKSLKENKKSYKSIKEENIYSFQYPLRKEFYQKKDAKQIKKDFNVQDDSPIILLMMGAQGSKSLYDFSKEIAKIKSKVHFFVCAGKNDQIIPKLHSLYFPPNITPHILGFTDRVSDLMAISDVMIGKTGAISVVEGLYSRLPLIADQTEYVVSWELSHQEFIEEKQTGFILKKLQDLPRIVENLLINPSLLQKIKNNINSVLKKQSTKSIEPIIKKIIG